MNLALVQRLDGYLALLAYVFGHWRKLRKPPVYLVLLQQINAIGIEALATISIVGAVCGVLVITQITAFAGSDNETALRVLIWILVRELAPLLTALIIISRTSAAMAVELALMGLHEEFAALERMGIRPEDYLLLPRVVGAALAVLAATICFQSVAVLSGLLASSFQDADFNQQLGRLLDLARLSTFLMAALKSLCFGVVIGVVACYHGATTRPEAIAIPTAGTSAVTSSLILVFLIDALFAAIELIAW